MKHIYLDKSFFIFLFFIVLTGNFNNFIVYFLLLFFHELGHTLMGILYGYQLDKISFYPTGGITTFNIPINISLKKELIILLMGPILQIFIYFIFKTFINNDNLAIYHYTLLLFNLLPIYPLDGGKILNILFNYKYNFLNSWKYSLIVSLIFIFLLNIILLKNFNLNLLLMIIVLFIKIIKLFRKRKYYYNKFLLERYLNNYSFSKIRWINNQNNFYRDYEHIINTVQEKDFLKEKFQK